MGLDYPSCRFMLSAKRKGVVFEDVLTLGRQAIFLSGGEFQDLGVDSDDVPLLSHGRPADLFIKKYLGATNVIALDNSDYEGASVRHDLNEPVPPSMHEKFDVVIDGGTAEHVFNYPRAIWNAVQMARVGGRIFLFTPANNYFGHGFYQFSPELFFSLCYSNSCIEVKRLVAVTLTSPAPEFRTRYKYFDVASPIEVGSRVCLLSPSEFVLLFVEIAKNDHASDIPVAPQQSDYVSRWSGSKLPQDAAERIPRAFSMSRWLFRQSYRVAEFVLPAKVHQYVRRFALRNYVYSLRNTRFFKQLRSL
jgi:hypothetical protein